MIDASTISQYIASIAGFITSFGVIMGAFYKWIWKPYEKRKVGREEKLNATMLEIAKGQTMPISNQLVLLEAQSKRHDETNRKLEGIAEQNIAIIHEMRAEFKEYSRNADERDKLIAQNAEIIKNHEDRLDMHNERLLILETVSGVQNKRYKFETEKGEENEAE